MLSNVRPTRAINNAADVAPVESKIVGNGLVRFAGRRASANGAHKIIVQHGIVMLLALLFAMLAHVSIVLAGRAPTDIREAIVAGVPVSVQTFHPIGTGTDEGQEDQLVKLEATSLSTGGANADDLPTVFVVRAGLQLPPRFTATPLVIPLRPNASIVANTITVEAGNVFVSGHVSILSQMDRGAIAL